MKDRDRPKWPLIEALNEFLKHRGFRKMGRFWRKEVEDSIVALVLENRMGMDIIDIRFGAWVRALGEAEMKDVRPNLYDTHIYMLLTDPCPNELKLKIMRAQHLKLDYFQVGGSGLLDADLEEVLWGMDKSEPLTDDYRIRVMAEAMEGYVLPVLEKMETTAGLRELLEDIDLMKAVDEKLFEHFKIPMADNGRLTVF